MTENCLPIVNWLKNWFTPKTEEYYYQITSSNYNPNIDSSVTITITVTDGEGNTVSNHQFTLNADGTDVSLTTNSQGVATYTYTCSNWGLHTFNTPSSTIQIKVTGWRTATDDTDYTIKYTDKLVSVCVHVPSGLNFSTTIKELGAEVLKHTINGQTIDLRPTVPITTTRTTFDFLQVSDTSYKVSYYRMSGSHNSTGAWGEFLYRRT